MTTVRRHVDAARALLVSAGLEHQEAAVDAEVLARSVLGWDRATYLADGRAEPPGDFPNRYRSLLERRVKREPVSLITGHREFWGLDFDVTSDVLTPRPETEVLVEAALARLENYNHTPHVVDVGTGSGCVAIVIAQQTDAQVSATDVSEAAIAVAKRNAERHNVSERIRWVCAPLLDNIPETPDVIVANLPYIPRSDISKLPPEVRSFEPHTALDGGPDGLHLITQLIDAASHRLAVGGYLIVELGLGQTVALSRYLEARPELEIVATHEDLRGIPRVVSMRRPTPDSWHPEGIDGSTPHAIV